MKKIIAGILAGLVFGGSLTAFAYTAVTAYIADLPVYFNGQDINTGSYKVLNYQPEGEQYPWIYVPLKAVGDMVYGRVEVDGNIVSVDTSSRIDFTVAELDMIAKLITAEEIDTGTTISQPARIGIGAVVVNRVLDNNYPNTISGVITQPNQWISISGITPTQQAIEAAYTALHGTSFSEALYYYYSPSITNPETNWVTRHTLSALDIDGCIYAVPE